MEEAETTSTATGANFVAEQDDTAMSNVETSGAAQPDQTKQVRVHAKQSVPNPVL